MDQAQEIADSLTTIKYMGFDNKLCSAKTPYDAVMADWEGYEDLRRQILSEIPHFGNNDPYAHEEIKWVFDTYYEICREYYSAGTRHLKPDVTVRSITWRKANTRGPRRMGGKPANR